MELLTGAAVEPIFRGMPVMATLADALSSAAQGGRTITLLGSDLQPRTLPCAELLSRAQEAANALLDRGIAPGDRVLLVLPTGEEFLAAFFGSILAGIHPIPLSPPQGAQPPALFRERLEQLTRALDVRAVIAQRDLELDAIPPDALRGNDRFTAPVAVTPQSVAFLQLTSGSTGMPKGVVITHGAAMANVRQIASGSGVVRDDVMVSWLPLFHDMGLVGGVLLPLAAGMSLVLSTPFAFLRRPAHWLQAISRHRGTHSLAPTFAYRQVADRASEREMEGVDLSSWRVAYVGAEPVHTAVLETFEQRFTRYGLQPTTLFPCYGMAEATLAVSMKPFRERYRTLRVSRAALARDERAVAPRGQDDALELVACGIPAEGMSVTIRDSHGHVLPDRRLGEITIDGPSVFSGYFERGVAPARIRFFGTGDLGFIDGNQLFITGRRKELIILAGENHHPAEIEWAAAKVDGIRSGRVAAFGVEDPEAGTQRLCLMAEVDRHGDRTREEALMIAVRKKVREETGLVVGGVEIVAAGTIPVTTSGKIQRGAVREMFLNGSRSPVSA